MAWMRARASNGRHSWVRELYGREPEVWTENLAQITVELMIEQQRQERLATAEGAKKFVDPDWQFRMSQAYWRMKRFVVWL